MIDGMEEDVGNSLNDSPAKKKKKSKKSANKAPATYDDGF